MYTRDHFGAQKYLKCYLHSLRLPSLVCTYIVPIYIDNIKMHCENILCVFQKKRISNWIGIG